MPAAPPPTQYIFRYSRAKTIAWLVFFIALGLLTVPTLLVLVVAIGQVGYVAAAVWAALLALIVRHLLKQLRHRQPVLVLDALGLVDHRLGPQRIPWRSLKRIDQSTLRNAQVMLLTCVDSATADALFGLGQSLNALSMRLDHLLTGLRPHAAIDLSDLEGSPRRVVQLAQGLHARATRGTGR